MADFTAIRKSRNVASSVLQVFLNLLLSFGAVFLTILTGSPLVGIILVLLSKWRTFAVRLRFLPVSLKSNLVDITVGLSTVMLTHFIGTTFMFSHALLLIFYIVWLLFIKPRTKEKWAFVQAICAIFLGVSAATIGGLTTMPILSVIFSMIVVYGATRHVLVQTETPQNFELIAAAFGVVGAEIAWLCQFWGIIYVFEGTGLMLPQAAVIIDLFFILFYIIFQSVQKYDGKMRARDIAIPAIFTVLIIAVIIFGFSEPYFNI